MKFVICLAEKNIEIQCNYSKIYEMCRNYLVEPESIDMHIVISDADIQYEMERSQQQNLREGKPVQNYGPDYLETLAVYRKISQEMLSFDTLLIHGSVVALNDKAVIFTGPSRIGKTTHSKMWIKNIPGSYILNGDKPLIRAENNKVTAFGTPWAGKEDFNFNRKAELCAVVFLEKNASNQITEINPMTEYGKLLRQTYIPEDASCMQKILELTGRICENVPFFHFHCNKEEEALQVSWNALKELLEAQA